MRKNLPLGEGGGCFSKDPVITGRRKLFLTFQSFADDVINLSVLKQNEMDLRFILYILYLALVSKSYRN